MSVNATGISEVMTAFVLQPVLILETQELAVGFEAFVILIMHIEPILQYDPMNNLHVDFLICMSMRLTK